MSESSVDPDDPSRCCKLSPYTRDPVQDLRFNPGGTILVAASTVVSLWKKSGNDDAWSYIYSDSKSERNFA